MKENRPYCISIAGFDPSAGAGVLADIKTFESLQVYGLGVNTANTIQHESLVKKIYWLELSQIIEQIKVLLKKYKVKCFKIGILPSSNYLLEIVNFIKSKVYNAFIIWDPILFSSSGFEIFKFEHPINETIKNIDLITPNLPEYEFLNTNNQLKNKSIYLKGGHNTSNLGQDILIIENETFTINPQIEKVYSKHGSGCILSSSILSFLAKGNSLEEACELAKYHTEKVLASNEGLLAFHFNI